MVNDEKRGGKRKEHFVPDEKSYFGAVEEFLRQREETTGNIKEGKDLKRYIVGAHLIIIICAALFGAVVGTYVWSNEDSASQVIYDAIKIPILILVTIYIALPVFYVFNLFTGGKLRIGQIAAVLFLSFSIMAFVLLAFSPVLLLFILTTTDYYFIGTFLVIVCGFAGYCGIVYFFDGYKQIHDNKQWEASLIVGSLVLIFGGTQLSWVFRPYLHSGAFKVIKDNFYIAVGRLFSGAPDIATLLLLIFGIIALIVSITVLAKGKKTVETKKEDVQARDYYPAASPAIPLTAGEQPKVEGEEVEGKEEEKKAEKPSLARCIACNSILELYDDGSGKCPQCGRQVWWDKSKQKGVELRCSNCGRVISPNWKFCPSCNYSVGKTEEKREELKCPNCNERVYPAWTFCPTCNSKVK